MSKKYKISKPASVAVTLCSLFMPVTGLAQAVLEELIVTATKTEKSAQDVGISLAAIDGNTLDIKGANDFSGYAEGLASLSFADRGPGQQLIAIRGVNSSTTIVNTDEPEAQAAVGVYIDETPVSLAGYSPDLKLFDINRIEVLRGPQGTLYGASSLSGTIRIITNGPNLSEAEGKVSLTFSNTEEGGSNNTLNGMINIPLIEDKLALRVTGSTDHDDGFIDNVAPSTDSRHPLFGLNVDGNQIIENVNKEDTYNVRAQLRYSPTDNFDATFKIFSQETDLEGSQTEDVFEAGSTLPGNNPANASLENYQQSRVTPEPYFDEFDLYSIEANWDLGFATLTSVTSMFDRFQTNDIESSDFLPALLGGGPFATTTSTLINSTDVQDFVQELRLSGSAFDDNVSYVAGVFYNQQDKVFIQDVPATNLTTASQALGATDICVVFGAPDCTTLSGIVGYPINPENLFESRSTFDTEQLALFGEVNIHISDMWTLVLGGRYYDYDQNFVFDEIGGIFAAGTTINNDLSETGFTPKVAVELRTDENILLYGSASQGFRLGGSNDPVSVGLCGANIPDFNSDSLWTYELGAKTQIDNRIQINGSAYFTDWKDVPISDPLDGACGFKQTVNSGNVEIYGLELELKFAVNDRLVWGISGSYTNAEFTSDVPGAVLPLVAASTDDLPIVPDVVLGTNMTYRFPFGENGLEGLFNVNASYRSSQFNQTASTGGVELDSYSNVNVKAGVEDEDWSISIFVSNLANEHNVIFKDTIFLAENRNSVARPRTLGVNLVKSF